MNRIIIYQVLVRLFGNNQTEVKQWGSLAENGSGKMNDFTEKALAEIKKMGFNHIWYTGLLEHATCTPYETDGIPADHPSVVKGIAGSPYAIKDYYDIAPALAEKVPERMVEFEQLIERTHKHGLKAIIDFVPNHLARQYHSDSTPKTSRSFGDEDDESKPFDPNNNFYYIPGQKLEVPSSNNNHQPIEGDYLEDPAKATGNDVFHPNPSINDWYETIKLNYGVDYLDGRRSHFDPIPDTWLKMKNILLFWAEKGVDGFRCDMAEMVPVEFWQWVIAEVKDQYQHVIFIAEVYQPDQYRNYLEVGGFDYLYDKVGLYDTLKSIIQGHASADQITQVWQSQEGIIDRMLRFLENHDEQRIASPWFAGEANKGIPMMAATAFMHKGPVMSYFGQDVGESAAGASGFSGDDGRTTIFDYWSVPTHQKWMNGGAFDGKNLSKEQRALRKAYINILKACNEEPLLQNGDFYDLQYFNRSQYFTGYSDQVFAFSRHNTKECVLVIINFSGIDQTVNIKLPMDLLTRMGINEQKQLTIEDSSVSAAQLSDQSSPIHFSTTLVPFTYGLYKVKSSQ